MRSIITGACGFAGSHLVEHLLKNGDEVFAIAAPGESTSALSKVEKDISIHELELRDNLGCDKIIREIKPDFLYHLAGVAFLPDAEKDPAALFAINVGGTINLAKAITNYSNSTRMIFISSAEVYGFVEPTQMPVSENQKIAPANLYAYSKVFAEQLLLNERKRNDLDVVICRPFTHIGPRQSPKFAASSFAQQIAKIEKNESQPVILVGNLLARRDIVDVRDMARAYRLAGLITHEPGPFNICSGKAVTIEKILKILLSLAKTHIVIEQDPSKFRPVDIPIYEGNPKLFSGLTGWSAQYSLNSTLEKLLDYWRKIT